MPPVEPDTLLVALLCVQGLLGGVDTLVNHEWRERLAARPEARTELGLHALRETSYTLLFAGLGWAAWLGGLAWLPLVLLAGEVIVTAVDEAVENRTRVLPQNERVLHVLLTLNLGAIIAVYAGVAGGWSGRETGVALAHHGILSWLLAALALLAAFWALRDARAFIRLGKP